MRTNQAGKQGGPARPREAGFTLGEMMVSTAVLMLLLGLSFSLLDQGQEAFMEQNASRLAQSRARKAINLMIADINLAGCQPVAITSGPAPGIQTAAAAAVRVIADRDGSGTTNGAGDINDDVAYSLVNGTLFRAAPNDPTYQSNGVAVAREMIGGVSALTFRYFDANGNELTAPVNTGLVRSVGITLVTSVTQLGNQTGTVTAEGVVMLRNRQLNIY